MKKLNKTAFIFVLYNTASAEVKRLKIEVERLGLTNYKIYFIDNTKSKKGYAQGANEGIKKAVEDKCDLFIVANPDISLEGIYGNDLLSGGKKFDIWGLAMEQQGKIYFGGEIDPWLLTGGLITEKPRTRFKKTGWISGSLMIIKRKVIEKIGYFSEDFFMYYEDVDYCYRAGKAGFRIGIDSNFVYKHFEVSANNPEKTKFLAKAKKIFFKKYANIWQRAYGFARFPKAVLEEILRFSFDKLSIAQDDKKTQSSFFVNFASLNISSLINKLLNFFLFIFLIRYLRPSEYGVYTLVWAQVSLFSPIVDLGTTTYGIIDLPTEKKQRFLSLFNLRLLIAIAVFFLTVFTGALMFKGNSRVVIYIFLTSIVIFSNVFSGSYLIKNAVEGKLYNSSLVSSIFNTLLILTLTFFIVVFKSLPFIFLISFIFYSAYCFINYFLIKKDLKELTFRIDIKVWRNFLETSYVYVLIGFLAGLYFKIDVFLLQIIKGEREVGIYSAGYKFFEGMMFIAASYNISRAPMLAKLAKKGLHFLQRAVDRDIFFFGLSGFFIAFFFYFFSPFILPIFLKGNYQESITVVRLVMFGLPFIFVSSVFLNSIYVLKKAKVIIYIFIFQVIINFILNLIFIPRYSYLASTYITLLSEILNTVIFFIIYKFLVKKTDHENIG
ncbi:hypothetical protein A2954_03230 [Candidatus Roizmanbacteria bacterium RIFCSPLOWO2_01_FULL_37_12]|uniref:Uncharacterized protein n=1 Tax=Candidatus Roizmanbacteria bacterium RIFCSPLOWO2_01_FULL_37_12 TaxID=1802056 RepID=A0A1F7I9A5_9BACT|nr:MAG: hypothetical protein A2954_03230 [Candidatus Roizmanbacteria bacterium RIFCSPLOWO2_01_FULL_37_12]